MHFKLKINIKINLYLFYLSMKKDNFIFESQGIVDKDGIQWFNLSELIVDYIFDLLHGLNNDNEHIITKGNIESYYQYIYKKQMPSYIIPEWIGTFKIHLAHEKKSKGSFWSSKAKLNNNDKLVFDIEINDTLDPNSMSNTLVHEF